MDVDGIDYHIWQSLTGFAPKLVCIEFNPTMPESMDFVQESDRGIMLGASLRALVNLAHRKQYELVAVTLTNAIFVRSSLFSLMGVPDNRISTLWTDRSFLTSVFYGYDGKMYLKGYCKSPWTIQEPKNG